ncbi:MAG: molybdopterin molybdotransferase MoeA [Paracoccaceae bacterium]
MISVEEALSHCLALVAPLPTETVPLRDASGRYLSYAVAALRDQPPFPASAMDGYAVRGDPAAAAVFRVIGEAGAGHAFEGGVSDGQAVRIFTGAPIPSGATRVIIQEDVTAQGPDITIKTDADLATHIRAQGQDFRIGDALSPRRLRPNDLALLAAMNVPTVPVIRRPVVAIIATGDELVMPGEAPRPDQIIASNSFAIAALVEAEGAKARLLPIARDTIAGLSSVLHLARDADVIVTIGGASVGDHDLVAEVAEKLGMQRRFWRIAMRPGKPLMAGRLGGSAMIGLPGNPVSAIVCTHLFILPMLRALQGAPDPAPKPLRAVLGADVGPTGPRTHYMRARLTPSDSLPVIVPDARQDSALLGVLAAADALLIRPLGDGPRPAGTVVDYLAL